MDLELEWKGNRKQQQQQRQQEQQMEQTVQEHQQEKGRRMGWNRLQHRVLKPVPALADQPLLSLPVISIQLLSLSLLLRLRHQLLLCKNSQDFFFFFSLASSL